MQGDNTPRPAGPASSSPKRGRKPRLRHLMLLLLCLLAFSSGLLGYRIGRGENARLSAREGGSLSPYELQVYSTFQDQADITAPDRLSLYGRVLDRDGAWSRTAAATLTAEGAASMGVTAGELRFPGLAQGSYTLSAAIPGEGSAQAALIIRKDAGADKIGLSRDEEGVYTLTAPAAAPYASLDLRLEKGFLTIALNKEVPTTGFDRLSLYGRVLDAQGQAAQTASVTLSGAGAPYRGGEGGAFLFADLPQGSYSLLAEAPGLGSAGMTLTILKTEAVNGARLSHDGEGAWTLTAAPSLSYARLDLRLSGDSLSLAINEEEQIPLKAFQFWQRNTNTEVNIFSQRGDGRAVSGLFGGAMIAPGSQGSFIFAVENPGSFPIEYAVSVREEFSGPYRLPMRYRVREDVLRAEDKEGWGEWLGADEVFVPFGLIQPGELRYYTLQWQWNPDNSALDTAIGTAGGQIGYRLHINVMQTTPAVQAHNL